MITDEKLAFEKWWEENYAHFNSVEPSHQQVALDAWMESCIQTAKAYYSDEEPQEEIKPLSIVKLTDECVKQCYDHMFDRDDFQFVYLGEIPNMPGHCVVIGWSTGKVYSGFHSENFRLLMEDE